MNKSELNKRVHATARALREKNKNTEPYKVYLKNAWQFWNDKMNNQQNEITLQVKEIAIRETAIQVEFNVDELNTTIKTWLPLSIIKQHINSIISLPIWLYNDRVRKYKLAQ